MDLAWANLQHIFERSKSTWHCHAATWAKRLHSAHIVLTLRKPSLANGWKGHEQMQEVSLASPLLVSMADSGDKLVKNVADLLCSASLNVGCSRAWLILNTWSEVEVKKRSSGCHDCHILGQAPVETTGWKESDSNSNETKQRGRHTNDTNLIFWRLRVLVLEPVPLWSRWDVHKQTAKANWLCANNRLGNAGYLSEFLKIGANQAQNLHIISFEAAALSAELSPATQVAMCPLAAKGLHGHNAGTKWKSACLGFGSFEGLAHNKTSKVTWSFNPDWSDWPNLQEMSLVAALIWPKCSFCAN